MLKNGKPLQRRVLQVLSEVMSLYAKALAQIEAMGVVTENCAVQFEHGAALVDRTPFQVLQHPGTHASAADIAGRDEIVDVHPAPYAGSGHDAPARHSDTPPRFV